MASAPQNRVLIVGAGLGGLTLAQSLRKLNVPYLILERDASPSARGQGWSIGISWIIEPLLAGIITSDKPDLRSTCANYVLGHDECLAFQSSCFVDGTTGRMVQRDAKKFEDVLELRASRGRLRDWLAVGVDIKWGKNVSTFTEDEEGVTVEFSDGTFERGAILVGADGVTSQVRQRLIPDGKTMSCLPVTILAAERRITYDQFTEITTTLAPAASVSYGDHILLALTLIDLHPPASSSGPGADFLWFLSSIDESERVLQEAGQSDGIEWMQRQTAKSSEDRYNEALETIKKNGMVEPFKTFVEETSSEEPVTPIFLREVRLGALPESRVTLLGDAAHAMSIFHGVAGNHAMLDALKLGPLLASLLLFGKAVSSKEVFATLKAYADEMLPRNLQEQTAARKSIFAMHRSLHDWQRLGSVAEGPGDSERRVWGKDDIE
ncbi:hypothetical protein FB451DRAFT_1291428 [Mycena latifolia]|nr:hypothetical protein FB451DRAFT_1291428 [Mycena latifolia]